VRRCYYRAGQDLQPGFYMTLYVFGYGEDEAAARRQCGIGLQLAGNAIAQLCEERSHSR